MVCAQRIVCGDDNADGSVHTGELFDDDGVFDVAHSRAAVSLRENDSEKTHVGQLRDDLDGKL